MQSNNFRFNLDSNLGPQERGVGFLLLCHPAMGKRLGSLDKKVHPKLVIISVEEKAIHQLLYGYKVER